MEEKILGAKMKNKDKGSWAVDRARTELQRMGLCVEVPRCPTSPGPDLEILYRNPGPNFMEPIRVEVKLANLAKCGKGKAWRVNRVCRNRHKDDLIAIVFPNGAVILLDMKSHLKLAGKNGDRYLRLLGRVFGD